MWNNLKPDLRTFYSNYRNHAVLTDKIGVGGLFYFIGHCPSSMAGMAGTVPAPWLVAVGVCRDKQ